ncbi:RmlC-like cupin domain-containing protein [Haematococcus lacustris]
MTGLALGVRQRVCASAHHPTRRFVAMSAAVASPSTTKLTAIPLTPETFKPFGQVIGASEDGKPFDMEDAQLQGFSDGTPRFYIMRIPKRGLHFNRITYHAKVTQCLGVLSPPAPWYMAVARPSGSVDNFPTAQDLTVFRIPHGVFVKMEKGTWHAGPLFDSHESMDFYNLELSDTNVVDHNSHNYGNEIGDFLIEDPVAQP